jgi:mono/diheme cytochrome c family protein
MKHFLFLFGALLLCTSLLLWMQPTSTTQALPEYAAQTGEPCSTCHVSPSGGGPRTPRGQAWVASGKSGSVPDLTQSLELLGVKLNVDPAYYTTVVSKAKNAEVSSGAPAQGRNLFRWLSQYDGN